MAPAAAKVSPAEAATAADMRLRGSRLRRGRLAAMTAASGRDRRYERHRADGNGRNDSEDYLAQHCVSPSGLSRCDPPIAWSDRRMKSRPGAGENYVPAAELNFGNLGLPFSACSVWVSIHRGFILRRCRCNEAVLSAHPGRAAISQASHPLPR